MRITSLRLHGFRVYEDLELEIPPGLVGIYGPNGAGKSSLLESILWALYGRARTSKGDIRTAGHTGECSVELGFEHDEHHYTVRRSLTGVNATVKARVHVGAMVAADGPAEVGRYLRSTLGMDEAAFRSSVFAEQKQLTAFSDNTPDQRRRLVLQLLGITPVEKARDAARDDARAARRSYDDIAGFLPDPAALDLAVVAATAEASAAVAHDEAAAATLRDAAAGAASAAAALATHTERAARHEQVRSLGVAARDRRDRAVADEARLVAEQATLHAEREELEQLRAAWSGIDLDRSRERLGTIRHHERAAAAVTRLAGDDEPPEIDESTLDAARNATASAEAALAAALATGAAAADAVTRAQTAAARSEELAPEADCPLCGQALGDGFLAVREHRAAELAAAVEADVVARRDIDLAQARVRTATAARKAAEQQAAAARAAHEAHAGAQARRAAALQALHDLEHELGGAPGPGERAELAALVARGEDASSRRSELEGRLARASALDAALLAARTDAAEAEAERSRLRAELDEVALDRAAHQQAVEQARSAQEAHDRADRAARDATIARARAESTLEHARRAVDDAVAQRDRVQELADRAVHLGRTADMLNGFRQTLVAAVGPRLSLEASALFNLLTAGEYDGLRIDPETYEIEIVDAGVAYGTARFSGSEVDLANLALRVAISEQVRFQTGGQVGLLVLDEALASLDADRKDRMLAALTQLAGRFRQILVVTHAPEVKEQLPQAIEVVKLPGRRATARIVEPV